MRTRSWFGLGLVNFLTVAAMAAWSDLAVAQGQPQPNASPAAVKCNRLHENMPADPNNSTSLIRANSANSMRIAGACC